MKRILMLAILGLAVLTLAGCTRSGDVGQAEAQSPDALLANVMETLYDDRPTVGAYASALKQLDTYVALVKKDPSMFKLSQAELDVLEGQILRGLIKEGQPNDPTTRTARINELQRDSFTHIDAYHLDVCFLFRDAGQALSQYYVGERPRNNPAAEDAYKLELARQAFQWVMRQVQLQPAASGLDPWPPQDILRRGMGDAEERARVFLALVEQLGLDGCMVPRTIDVIIEGKREPRELPWAPGVLIGKDVFLFEPRLEKPIPSADGKGIATLREVVANADILKNLYAGDADPVTLAQLEKPVVLIPNSYAALSPRMRALQGWLDNRNKAILHQDLPAIRKRFQDANLNAEIRLWTSRSGNPALILNRHVENPRNELRLQEVVVPRRALVPAWMHELTSKLNPGLGEALFQRFDNLFLSVRLQPVGLEEERIQRQGQMNIPGLPKQQVETVQRRRGGVRDLLVRGRPEQSVERILDLETRLQKQMDVFHDEVEITQGRVEVSMQKEWAPQVIAAQNHLNALAVRRQSSDKSQAIVLEDDMRKAWLVLQGMIQERSPMIAYLSTEWALPDISEHLTYFMALSKMELAVRAEVQAGQRQPGPAAVGILTPAEHWQSAADWFERYQALILPRTRTHWAASAAKHLAACRAAQARLEQKK